MRVYCEKHEVVTTVNCDSPYDIGVCPKCLEEGLVTKDKKWPYSLRPYTQPGSYANQVMDLSSIKPSIKGFYKC